MTAVPTAAPPHEACVTSTTTAAVCQPFVGGPDVTATAAYTATVAVALPTVAGGATLSGYLVSPTPVPLGTTTVPGDTVAVSYCNTP